jgi:hypothetical protein
MREILATPPPCRPHVSVRIRRFAAEVHQGVHVQIAADLLPAARQLRVLCGSLSDPPIGEDRISLPHFAAWLCFSAVNYCYWVDDGSKPLGGSSGVRDLMLTAFGDHQAPGDPAHTGMQVAIAHIQTVILNSALQLRTERSQALAEISKNLSFVQSLWEKAITGEGCTEVDLDTLLTELPSFATDPFAKRAMLFFMLLDRCFGLSSGLAKLLPLPVDYQIPKVLRAAGAIIYTPALAAQVDAGFQIKSGSPEELEMRAATLLTVDRLSAQHGVPVNQLDDWMWGARYRAPGRFHRTVTTAYGGSPSAILLGTARTRFRFAQRLLQEHG